MEHAYSEAHAKRQAIGQKIDKVYGDRCRLIDAMIHFEKCLRPKQVMDFRLLQHETHEMIMDTLHILIALNDELCDLRTKVHVISGDGISSEV